MTTLGDTRNSIHEGESQESTDDKVVSLAEFEEKQVVHDILLHKYGLSLISYQKLGGFDDVNYLVTVADDDSNSRNSFGVPMMYRYVLRIVNATDSKEPERMKAINAAMRHVQTKGIMTQDCVRTLQGEEITLYKITTKRNSSVHVVILRHYLLGTPLASEELTPTLLFDFGVFVAKMTQALEDFSHPFFKTFMFSWSLDNTGKPKEILQALKDQNPKQQHQHQEIETIMEACDKQISLVKHLLRRGHIHGDLNLSNIILTKTHNLESKCPLGQHNSSVNDWAVLDFHDSHRTFLIHELATSSALMMFLYLAIGIDRENMPGHILAGYRSVISVSPTELQIFPYLVIRHVCMMHIGCQLYKDINPDNAHIPEVKERWKLIESLWEISPGRLAFEWEQVTSSREASRLADHETCC